MGTLPLQRRRSGQGRLDHAFFMVVHTQDHRRSGGEHRLNHPGTYRIREAPSDLRQVPQG